MSLLGPEGVSHLALQGPEAVNARLESFSRYVNALLEHVLERMSAATAATREGSTRPKPLLVTLLVSLPYSTRSKVLGAKTYSSTVTSGVSSAADVLDK
ncbi:hypothetical protein PI125_g21980 [Phytophthora idaei]|nr:hypothetical protein PI125_g21980 [Phytophthora idaei]KAG3130871.1 hypothetical protein PI126_g20307 [Phytophthora idaei]